MNRNELRRADLGMLIAFEMLMQERSVTRAAERLFLGQPAVSAALSRLRDLFDDPLFIRVRYRMEPTATALRIYELLSPALDGLSSALSITHDFQPATSEYTFRLGLQDDVEYSLLPALLTHIRQVAPGVKVVIKPTNRLTVSEQLTSGQITTAVCVALDLPANAVCKCIRAITPTLIRGDGINESPSVEEYCRRPHIVVSHAGETNGYADQWLAKIGKQRDVVLAVSQFNTLPALIANTDLLSNLPDYLAEALKTDSRLSCVPMPFPVPTLDLSMIWLSTFTDDPAERWLRTQVETFFGRPPATQPSAD